MELYSIETGRFKLDGGAMFGVVPKTIWQRTNPPDESNRIDMAMRCLLIKEGSHLILVDNGLGHKYNSKFRDLYDIDHTQTLDSSLAKLGLHRNDITDLILTHLHFDHGGGTTAINSNTGNAEVCFPNAKIYIQKSHWDWANHPNAREKASFFKENLEPIQQSGQMVLLDGELELFSFLSIKVVHGHTEGQQLPLIHSPKGLILYVADLFPTFGHLPLPYVMGYDVRPLMTLDERAKILPWLVENNVTLFYEHDPLHECGKVVRTDRGGYATGELFPLASL